MYEDADMHQMIKCACIAILRACSYTHAKNGFHMECLSILVRKINLDGTVIPEKYE